MAHLGISIKDSEFISIDVYAEIIDIELKTMSSGGTVRKATQVEIDLFLG